MGTISRRVFLKSATLAGAAMAAGSATLKPGRSHAAPAANAKPDALVKDGVVSAVSDVDGHSQCRMKITVKDGRVVAIDGDPADPEGRGRLTLRDRHMAEILYAPDRLGYPLKRKGDRGAGQWERISWDEALATIANRFAAIKAKYGAEAIDFHRGHHHSGDFGGYLVRLANLIGTPNVSTTSHVCHMPRVFLQYYFDFGAVVPPDIAHTRCLIIWGGNPAATNTPQALTIDAAVKRGAKLLVVDPRVTPYARKADIHAQLRPGTDAALALGMLQVIISEGLYDKAFVEEWTVGFERLKTHVQDYPPERVAAITRVPARTIRELARTYASARPACISLRNAMDQHTNAAAAIRAVDILMAVTGNLDVKGGNVISIPMLTGLKDVKLYDRLPQKVREKKIGADRYLWSRLFNEYPSTHTPSLWKAILEEDPYPVKAMMVMGANPALASANTRYVRQALKKLDFLVAADLFMTPTAELADIVLPVCTFLEKTRYVTYSTHADHWWQAPARIALSPQVVAPVKQARSDWQIVCDLARRMGYGAEFPWKKRGAAIDYELAPLGITCRDLEAHPDGITLPVPPFLYRKFDGITGVFLRKVLKVMRFGDYPHQYEKYAGRGFFTPSKKVEIFSQRLADEGCDPLPVYREPAESPVSRPDLAGKFPLVLIAGTKLPMYTHSMMRNIGSLRKRFPENRLEIHPETAAHRSIEDQDKVWIESPRGAVGCRAQVTRDIMPGVVQLHHGFEDANCNVLTDNENCDPVTGSPGLKSLLCQVRRG